MVDMNLEIQVTLTCDGQHTCTCISYSEDIRDTEGWGRDKDRDTEIKIERETERGIEGNWEREIQRYRYKDIERQKDG